MIKKALFLIISLAILFPPALVKAESYDSPEVIYSGGSNLPSSLPSSYIHGSQKPRSGGVVLYNQDSDGNNYYYLGGFLGNSAVYNYDPNVSLGYNYSNPLTDSDSIRLCINALTTTFFIPSHSCFNLSPNNTQIKNFVSTTTVNYIDKIETTALLYPDRSMIGDVYSGNGDLSNFALYGRNLAQTNGVAATNAKNGAWNTDTYTLNPQAQASYTAEQKTYFDTHYNQLFGEATKVNNINTIYWGLQNEGMIRTGGSISATYPEGAVWKNTDGLTTKSNLTLNNSQTYLGKGTIIVNGDLTIKSGVNIQKSSGSDVNTLGLIVLGNVILEGNNQVDAAIFATGNIKIGNNVKMSGSFVASNFTDLSGGNLSSSYGIQIFYDYRLEDNWPPGFRYFNMPTAQNAAP